MANLSINNGEGQQHFRRLLPFSPGCGPRTDPSQDRGLCPLLVAAVIETGPKPGSRTDGFSHRPKSRGIEARYSRLMRLLSLRGFPVGDCPSPRCLRPILRHMGLSPPDGGRCPFPAPVRPITQPYGPFTLMARGRGSVYEAVMVHRVRGRFLDVSVFAPVFAVRTPRSEPMVEPFGTPRGDDP